eukprot:1156136-Pelagomonas_calceolata.AAC.6
MMSQVWSSNRHLDMYKFKPLLCKKFASLCQRCPFTLFSAKATCHAASRLNAFMLGHFPEITMPVMLARLSLDSLRRPCQLCQLQHHCFLSKGHANQSQPMNFPLQRWSCMHSASHQAYTHTHECVSTPYRPVTFFNAIAAHDIEDAHANVIPAGKKINTTKRGSSRFPIMAGVKRCTSK